MGKQHREEEEGEVTTPDQIIIVSVVGVNLDHFEISLTSHLRSSWKVKVRLRINWHRIWNFEILKSAPGGNIGNRGSIMI